MALSSKFCLAECCCCLREGNSDPLAHLGKTSSWKNQQDVIRCTGDFPADKTRRLPRAKLLSGPSSQCFCRPLFPKQY